MIAAIGARTDLSFDAGTGTLTYTGTGSPMPNLVISLAAVNDGLVEGNEQYTVSLSSPGSTTGANVAGSGSVQTTITDTSAATWSLSGDTGVTEGNAASYTVHLAGTLQTNETATIHLAIANITTTSADYASFVTAVNTAITGRTDLSFDAGTGTLTYTGTGSPMADLLIHLGTTNDSQLEGNEQYSVSLSNPGSTSGADVVGTASVTTTIIDNDPAAGTPITLQVDEAALPTGSIPSLTTEIANNPLSFTAAGFNLVSFAFSSDISGLTKDLNNDGSQDIFWVRDSGTQISGYLDAAHTQLADRLTLSAPAARHRGRSNGQRDGDGNAERRREESHRQWGAGELARQCRPGGDRHKRRHCDRLRQSGCEGRRTDGELLPATLGKRCCRTRTCLSPSICREVWVTHRASVGSQSFNWPSRRF